MYLAAFSNPPFPRPSSGLIPDGAHRKTYLHRLSRPRGAARRLAQSRSGGAAAPRWWRGKRCGQGVAGGGGAGECAAGVAARKGRLFFLSVQWAKDRYGVRVLIMVVQHTFGRRLNFNSHLHILVSAGGRQGDVTGHCDHKRSRGTVE